MYRIRTVKTTSEATAVQVVEYFRNKRKILLHLGSAKNDEELALLKKSALCWIEKNNPQLSFFPLLDKEERPSSLISLDKCQYLGFRYQLLYDSLWQLGVLFKFHLIAESKILNDLVISRIVAPGSKVEAFKFIKDYFGISHSRRGFYRQLKNLDLWKNEAQSRMIAVAKKYFNFNFSMVFYDLTTLYFESFKTDDVRKIGFSKDNKASQPQIMIGLLVNDSGFPVSYQLFPGNKFEGHSLMPSILHLRKKYKIEQMTIVADSAMLSDKNIQFLKEEKLKFIVAARTANLPIQTIMEISEQLSQTDEAT